MEGITRRSFLAGGTGTGMFVLLGGAGGVLGGLGLVAAEADAAHAAGTHLRVWLWARPGLPSTTYPGIADPADSDAEFVAAVPMNGAFASGTALGYLCVASNGQLITGVGTQTGDFNLTARGQHAAVFTRSSGAVDLALVGIPTSGGVLVPPHAKVDGGQVFVDGYGGADTSDIAVFSDANGEHVVLNSMRPYAGEWKAVATNSSESDVGVFPALPVLTRNGTTWTPDADYSATTDQLRNNSTFADRDTFFVMNDAQPLITDSTDKWRGNLAFAELERFPNGEVLVSQYFSSSDTHASGVVVAQLGAPGVDPKLVAGYAFPLFADARVPGGPHNIAWSCRNVAVDPTFTNPSDYRFFVSQDAFLPKPVGIKAASRDGSNRVTIQTQTDHGLGVGQTPVISGLAGDLAVLNTPEGSIGIEPVDTVVNTTTFTMLVEGPAVSGTITGAPTAQLRLSAATVEMRYNSVTGVIEPVSMPFHVDHHRSYIGTVVFTDQGDVVLTPGGPAPWTNGPLSVISKWNRLPENGQVPFTAAHFADGWGTVRHPDAAFASTAGPGSFAGTVVLDGQTAYWPSNDFLRRVTIDELLQPQVVQRVADPRFTTAPLRYTGFFTTVARVAPPASPPINDPVAGGQVLCVTSTFGPGPPNSPPVVTAPKASSTELIPVVPGQTYVVFARFRAGTESNGTSMTRNASIGVQFKTNVHNPATNTYGNVGGPVYSAASAINNELWSNTVLIVTAPAGAAGVVLTTKVENMGPLGLYYVDDTQFLDRNRMTNPGFEWPLDTPSNDATSTFPGFAAAGGTAVIAATGSIPVRSGTRALKITPDSGGVATCTSPVMPAVALQSYTGRGWVRPIAGEARVTFGMEFVGSGQPAVFGPARRLTGTTFEELIVHGVAPKGTTGVKLVIKVDRAASGASVVVDDLSFEEAPGASLPQVDLQVSKLRRGGPDTQNGGAITSGRPVVDRARRRLYIPVVQFGPQAGVRYPTFSTFFAPGTPTHITGIASTLSYDQLASHGPGNPVKRVLKVQSAAPGAAGSAVWNDRFDAAPGVDYAVSGWFRADLATSPLPSAVVGVRWTKENGTTVDTFGAAVAVAASGWAPVDKVVRSPANAKSGQFIVRVDMPSSGQTFWLDDLVLKLAHGGQVPPVTLDQYLFEVELP